MLRKDYQVVIGLEIHAQINTKSKLFSSTSTEISAPNMNVNWYDIGTPGILPRLNKQAVKLAVQTGYALNCTIQNISQFDRKHYFYPDLPSGFQITQYFHPICTGGYIDNIRINRIHIESDAGKMHHQGHKTLIDFNRVGCPLMEIVTEPDFRSIEQVNDFLNKLILRLKWIESCACNLELGEFRVDVNVSVNKEEEPFGTRCEIKNLNSIYNIRHAIEFEVQRQIDELLLGKEILQESRGYNPDTKETFSMREKTDADHYCYYRDWNIPILNLSEDIISKWISEIKYLPQQKREQFKNIISKSALNVIIDDKKLFQYFEKATTSYLDAFANVLTNEFMGMCQKKDYKPYDTCVSADNLSKLIDLIENKKIQRSALKKVLEIMLINNKDAEQIIVDENLLNITDENIIKQYCNEIIIEYTELSTQYKNGDNKIMNVLIGKLMKKSRNIDPQVSEAILKELIYR